MAARKPGTLQEALELALAEYARTFIIRLIRDVDDVITRRGWLDKIMKEVQNAVPAEGSYGDAD